MNVQTEEMTVLSAQPTEEKLQKKSKKSMPLGIKIFLCVLFSVVFLAVSVAAAASFAVRLSVTKDKVNAAVENTDYMTVPFVVEYTKTNLYEVILSIFGDSTTDKVDMYSLAKRTRLEKTVAEYIYSYAKFILYNDRLDEITSETVKEFYTENYSKISTTFGTNINNNAVYNEIDSQQKLFETLSEDGIENIVPAIGLIRFVMSVSGLIVMGVIALAMIVLIAVVSKKAGVVLVSVGTAVTVTGLAGAGAAVFAMFFATLSTAAGIAVQGVISTMVPDIFLMFVYILTAGVLLILTGGFVGRIRKNIKNAKNS